VVPSATQPDGACARAHAAHAHRRNPIPDIFDLVLDDDLDQNLDIDG
jgi:hypothetical protein